MFHWPLGKYKAMLKTTALGLVSLWSLAATVNALFVRALNMHGRHFLIAPAV